MATQLKAVALDLPLARLIYETEQLRLAISHLVPDAADVALAIGRDGESFDVTITLSPLTDAARTIFILEANKLPGIHFTKIATRPVQGTINRRAVTASVVSAEGLA